MSLTLIHLTQWGGKQTRVFKDDKTLRQFLRRNPDITEEKMRMFQEAGKDKLEPFVFDGSGILSLSAAKETIKNLQQQIKKMEKPFPDK